MLELARRSCKQEKKISRRRNVVNTLNESKNPDLRQLASSRVVPRLHFDLKALKRLLASPKPTHLWLIRGSSIFHSLSLSLSLSHSLSLSPRVKKFFWKKFQGVKCTGWIFLARGDHEYRYRSLHANIFKTNRDPAGGSREDWLSFIHVKSIKSGDWWCLTFFDTHLCIRGSTCTVVWCNQSPLVSD